MMLYGFFVWMGVVEGCWVVVCLGLCVGNGGVVGLVYG